MKMIEHTHFICHFYSPIPVISHTILPYKTFLKKSDDLF